MARYILNAGNIFQRRSSHASTVLSKIMHLSIDVATYKKIHTQQYIKMVIFSRC